MHTAHEDYVADKTTFRQLRIAVTCMCIGAVVLVAIAGAISASL